MANQLLSIDAEVPSRDLPGTPALVIYDNGDWEFAFFGDTDYIIETSPNYLGFVKAIDLIDELRLIDDEDICEVSGDRTLLSFDMDVNVGAANEYVIAVFADGTTTIMYRSQAEKMVAHDGALHNFIPVVDMNEELLSFLSYHEDDLFDEESPYDGDYSDYDREGLDD